MDGQIGQVDRHESMDRWNRWKDVNRWTDGQIREAAKTDIRIK